MSLPIHKKDVGVHHESWKPGKAESEPKSKLYAEFHGEKLEGTDEQKKYKGSHAADQISHEILATLPLKENSAETLDSPAIDTPADKYQVGEVWNRFVQKYGEDKSEEELEKIYQEAEAMANYAQTNVENKPNVEQIKADLEQKVEGAEVTDAVLYGKLFALSLKVASLVSDPSNLMGVKFESTYDSIEGHTKPTAATRLFKATPIIHSATDNEGNVERKGMLIIKKLGEGGFNKAHLVYHQHLQKEMVLREMNFEKLEAKHDRQNIQKFEKDWTNEVAMHKWLLKENIPGLVGLHEVYTLNSPDSPKVKALMLEKGDGSCLELIKKTSLSDEERKSAFKQRITTLAGMHEKEVAHGDYKPENVFYVINDQGKIETKVADFGFTSRAELKRGGMMGTIAYKPIDGFLVTDRGSENALFAKQTDAWAEGLTALEMRYGEFNEHHATLTEIKNFSDNFIDLDEVKAFKVSHDSDLISNRKYDLLDALKVRYPLVDADDYLEMDANKQNLSEEEFLQCVHDEILLNHYYGKYEEIFGAVCDDLENGTNGRVGDEEDKMIARLLKPNVDERSSPVQERNNLHLLN